MSLSRNSQTAIQYIQSGQRVFVHGGASTPTVLLEALVEDAKRLKDVELIHLHTEGTASYASPEYKDHFRVVSLFAGQNIRGYLNSDRVDYLPCFLSEIPALFLSGRRPIDVALLHLSPPDRHGFCTLGASVDVARAASQAAKVLVAQINKQMPRVHGDGFIHIDELDAYIEVDVPLPPHSHSSTPEENAPEEKAIGNHVASLIENGSCLQVGIGSIPNAVLAALVHHRHLGVHSEMWSDGVLKLLHSGCIDNSRKTVHPGKTVSSFVLGSRAVYDHIDDNPSVIQLGADYVNNPSIIARNSKVAAINSAVEIDLTGQVCADSVGHRILSGVGGQMDFMRGAALSPGGKPIIAITSRTKSGKSKIVAELAPGAGVITTRSHIHYVVTEYGVADLAGCTLGERAKKLIEIAHPEDREKLQRKWHDCRNESHSRG